MDRLFVLSQLAFVLVNCNPCSETERLDITAGEEFGNGSIVSDGVEYGKGAWFEEAVDGIVLRFGCPCIGRVCMWKCCGAGEAFFGRNCSATEHAALHPFSPTVFRGKEPVATAHDSFFYMHSALCEERYLLDSSQRGVEMYIQENGTLFEMADNRAQWHVSTMYCADMMMMAAEGGWSPTLVAAVCYPDDLDEDSSVLYIAYSVGLLLSVPFLLVTFIVYAITPALRNLHGMCLMAYCAGLMVAYVCLAYLKLHTGQIGVGMTGCLVVAFFVYYSFQTSFFWLNVMCFDVWRTFSGYRGGSKNKGRDRRRFAFYGLYAWGVPALLTGFTVLMQMQDHLPPHIVRPRLGERRCWFDNWISELVYFYTPVLALVVCNVGLFTVTALKIRSIHQDTAILKSSESARSDRLKHDQQRYGLYLKLFVMMGVNWTVELISFAVGGSNWYWAIVDISNLVLGVFIFIIFVWNNNAKSLLRKRFRSMTSRRSGLEATSTGRWATRSSSAHTEDTRLSSTAHQHEEIRLRDVPNS